MQGNNRILPQFSYINGGFVDQNQAVVSIQDRGFRFGDGVFETIRIENGAIYQLDVHMLRLAKGLQTLRITADTSILPAICRQLRDKNGVKDGFLRIAISRGVGSKGYLPDTDATPTIVVETVTMATAPTDAIDLWLSRYTKPSARALPVVVKTMQGLNSTLARMEAQDHQCFEALLCSDQGMVCEASSANIFWVKDKVLYTPALEVGVLAGTIRAAVLRLSPYPVQVGIYPLQAILQADEVFITNVAWLIVPVTSLQPIGKVYTSHKITKEINALLKKDIKVHALA